MDCMLGEYPLNLECTLRRLTFNPDSERTIARRWKEMGLKGSRATEAEMTCDEIKQLVEEEMACTPSGRSGQNTIKKSIALRTGFHLKRYSNYQLSDYY